MSKQFIQFASVLFMLAALLAVSAQENTTALNNATMNNTTLLNNTTLNASVIEVPILPIETANEIIPAQNETVPVQNEPAPTQIEEIASQNETAPAQDTTQSENITAVAEPVSTISPIPLALQPGAMQIGSPQRTTFTIGGIGRTPSLFPIDSKALAQDAYKVGLPAETIMDLSALPFFVNKI
jgi:hypothetical protein